MHFMTKLVDYLISPQPIRIVDLKMEPSKLTLQSLHIVQMGHIPGRILQRSRAVFEHWAFGYITGGQGVYRQGGGPAHKVTPGSLFFVYPGAEFDYGPDAGGSWDEYYICFEGNRVAEWIDQGILQKDSVWNAGVSKPWIDKIEMIFPLMESGVPANADRASLLLESLLLDFVLSLREQAPKQKTATALTLLKGLADELYQQPDIEKLADAHNISASTLRRLVCHLTGFPVHEYILRLKMEEAKRLLLNTTLQIQEIAQMLGFNDNHYFSRWFKKRANLPPNEFRRKF